MKCFLAASVLLVLVVNAFGHSAKSERELFVTMSRQEFLVIVRCVAKSRDPVLQRKLLQCETLLPQQEIVALEKCRPEVVPDGMKKCNYFSVLYDTPEIAEKILDCISENTEKLTEEERKKTVSFENCSRELYNTCKRTQGSTGHLVYY